MINNNSIRNKLAEIAKIIFEEDFSELRNCGLFDGISGIALFCFLYYKETGKREYWDKGLSLINKGIEIAGESSITSICSGLCGLAWTCRFLNERNILDNDEIASFDEADDLLYRIMIVELSQNSIDFLHSSVGKAIYFADRLKNEKYLRDCVTMLQRLSVKDEHGRKWIFSNKDYPDSKTTNLSLSHGMSSIVILLSKIYLLLGGDNEYILPTIKESVTFLTSQRYSETDDYRSLFPSLEKKIDYKRHSRMGWCYGDLGVALALYHAANALSDQALKQYSIDCFLHSSQRKDLRLDSVYDCGLCHGTAGIALMFLKMYKNTGIEYFKNVYEFWFNKTLSMASYEDGLAGYKTRMAYEDINDHTLLTGIAGIGLALLSLISKEDLFWDECFLLS